MAIIARSYNTGYMGRWCDQLGELLPDQDFDSPCDAPVEVIWVMTERHEQVEEDPEDCEENEAYAGRIHKKCDEQG